MRIFFLFLSAYLFIINLAAFLAFGLDKRKAKKKRRRIPERRLFFLALLGGSLGAQAGMLFFHHKTRHIRFVIGIPALFLLQGLLLFFLIRTLLFS